jgi:hypothetical protein
MPAAAERRMPAAAASSAAEVPIKFRYRDIFFKGGGQIRCAVWLLQQLLLLRHFLRLLHHMMPQEQMRPQQPYRINTSIFKVLTNFIRITTFDGLLGST